MKPKIVVVGSSNTDMVVKLPRLPGPGETIIGGTFSMAAGGKGANQAVAASRAGGAVTFISKIGNDYFGAQAIEGFRTDGVDTRFVEVVPGAASGIALIFVDGQGENCIGVASGANNTFPPKDLDQARDVIASADVLLLQLEIPLETVEAAARLASLSNVKVILNPAPARELSDDLLRNLTVITPNEHEAETLTGERITDDASIIRAARVLLDRGVPSVVITLGARGAYVDSTGFSGFVQGFNVRAIDSTAAGDVFNGSLAVSLGEGLSLQEAARFGNAAAAISVTRLGAQPSAPTRVEIETALGRAS